MNKSLNYYAIYQNIRPFSIDNNIIVNDKFIIVQTPKTGSTTLRDCFKRYNNYQTLKKQIAIGIYRHEGIAVLSNLASKKEFPNIEYIGTCRNPYAQLISWYFHCVKFHNQKNSFNHYIMEQSVRLEEACGSQFNYHSLDGQYIMDKVYPFECGIKNTINDIIIRHNLKNLPNNIIEKHSNQNTIKSYQEYTKNHNWREIISKKTLEHIQDKHQRDFDFYGYSYDPDKMLHPPYNFVLSDS